MSQFHEFYAGNVMSICEIKYGTLPACLEIVA